jgi:hypothetical protein
MKRTNVLPAAFAALLLTSASTYEALATPDAKAAPATSAPATQPASMIETPSPVSPDAKPPTDIADGIDTARTLWQAIKDKAWWLVAACGVFLVMLVLQLAGLFRKMGKRWTWIVAGVLSFAAATCLAFDKDGFSWNAFLGFATAGPTIAWLRGFVKKAVLNFQKE